MANFLPTAAPPPSAAATPAPPPGVRAQDPPVAGHPAAPRPGRARQAVDAIHALTSTPAVSAAQVAVAAQALAPTPVVASVRPQHHGPAGGPSRDAVGALRDVATAAAVPEAAIDREPDAKRPSVPASPADPRGERREPAPVLTADKGPLAPLAGQPPAAAPVGPPPTSSIPVPQVVPAAQPLYDLATADASLQATALGKNAHVHLDAGPAGALSLHLSVQDGVADLEIEGPAAERLDLRPEELRRALASEGLALGHFTSRVNESADTRAQQDDTSSRQQNGADRGPAPEAPRPTTPFASQAGASSYGGGENRRHWQGETPDLADRDRRPGAATSAGGSPPSTEGDANPARRRGVHVTA